MTTIMRSRFLKLAFVLLLPILASGAQAAIQDFVNGRMVGKTVEPMRLDYFGAKPASLGNKVVLIDFWAVWCEPCRHSIPELNKLHAELGERGLVVLGMTRDDGKSIADFVTRFPMQFPVGTDVDGAFFKRLAVRAMPYAVLADRSGTIIWQGDPGELTRERIEAALGGQAKTFKPGGR